MVEQYPHILTYSIGEAAEDVWDEENGGWIPGTSGGETVEVECRAAFSRSWRQTRTAGGTILDYEYDIAFPLEVAPIPDGRMVKITDKKTGVVVVEANLLHFQSGQLHNMAWI